MPKRRVVFISYSEKEEAIALRIIDALKQAGFQTWLSRLRVEGGQEWHGEIDTALRSSGITVVLWSELSMDSRWVRHEASQAMALGTYLPVRIKLIDIKDPYDRLQAIDLYDWNKGSNQSEYWNGDTDHSGFQNLVRKLRQKLPSRARRVADFLWQYILVIMILPVVLGGYSLLVKQNGRQQVVLSRQVEQQQAIFDSVKKQNITLSSQLRQQGEMSQLLASQQKALESQLQGQKTAASRDLAQSKALDDQLRRLDNIANPIKSAEFFYSYFINGGLTINKEITPQLYIFDKKKILANPVRYKFNTEDFWREMNAIISLSLPSDLLYEAHLQVFAFRDKIPDYLVDGYSGDIFIKANYISESLNSIKDLEGTIVLMKLPLLPGLEKIEIVNLIFRNQNLAYKVKNINKVIYKNEAARSLASKNGMILFYGELRLVSQKEKIPTS